MIDVFAGSTAFDLPDRVRTLAYEPFTVESIFFQLRVNVVKIIRSRFGVELVHIVLPRFGVDFRPDRPTQWRTALQALIVSILKCSIERMSRR
jgi:hypothetical protein